MTDMAPGPVTAPSSSSSIDLLTHRDEISKLLGKSLSPGDVWYLVESYWFKQWERYVGRGTDNEKTTVGSATMFPGPIDNGPILDQNSVTGEYSLKPDLLDELNYVLVPEEAWQNLKEKFGVRPGQPEISRVVVESGMFVKQKKIEVYPLSIDTCLYNAENDVKKFVISRTKTYDNFLKTIREAFKLNDNQNFRLVIKHADGNTEILNVANDVTLQDSGLYSGQTLVVDVQNIDRSWNVEEKKSDRALAGDETNRPMVASGSMRTSSSQPSGFGSTPSFSSFDSAYGSAPRKLDAPGLCGLSNLGNTCFMNSALQCMSNTPPLTEYLLSGRYESEINESNPLGMRGEMAKAFAELIKQMWTTKSGAITPRGFKITVGRFAPTFSGYQQQDSQELLAFLLDGLHEDLNRVRKKPYVELKDNDGKSDAEAAAEAWANYKLRNDSIVVDLFHGLLKSTLVCPECSKVSVTFDPFCYLSLPLPMKKERQIVVTFVPLKLDEPLLRLKVTTPKNGNIRDLAESLSRMIGKSPDQFVIAEVYTNRFHKFFYSNDPLSNIVERDDIFAYETERSSNEPMVSVRVYNRVAKKQQFSNLNSTGNLVGVPMVILLKKDQLNYNGLRLAAKNAVARFVDWPADDDVWCQNENEEEDDSGVDDDDSNNAEDRQSAAASVPSTSDKPELFRMVLTNSFGTSEINQVGPGRDVPIVGDNDIYLCLEWHPLAQKFFTADLPIENHESMLPSKVVKKNMQLSDCLDLFTTTEKLGEHDLWFCPGCKKHQQATKKFDLWSVPEILIIHLKRFSYSRIWRDKIEGLVEFAIEGLDINPWIISDKMSGMTYDLIAVSNHFGGLGGGHYTAYAKNKSTGNWYLFDDSSVSSVDKSEVVTKAAYVLVYARRKTTHESDPNVEMEEVE